ncbi:MAG: DKNYY domain-containing protein [Mycobacterium sp.]
MRRLIAAVSLFAVAILPACTEDAPPSSLFNAGGYHVRGEKVYYLHSFPGDAFEIDGADAASFLAFDQTYARDESTVYVDGRPLPGADAATFELLDRPDFASDARHVYQRDCRLSDDPTHFELLDGNLSKDSAAVYWSDGEVLSDDPAHFAIISNADYYLFTRDSRTVHVNGKPIEGADPQTFRVLNADFECTADARHAYYRNSVVAGADPSTFPPNRAVTRCDETSISFAE